jgi:DNA-binding transcriptional regulator YiaG
MTDAMKNTRIENRAFSVAIPDRNGTRIAERLTILVEMEWDEELQEWNITDRGLQAIEDTKARHMGLMLPDELRHLRERLQLTQSEMSELLQLGEKSWTRWESGKQRPSKSVNLLIRALDEGELTIDFLQRSSRVGKDWRQEVAFRKAAETTRQTVRMDTMWRPPAGVDGHEIEALAGGRAS